MKTKSKVLIGLMAACLAGGVGSAFALTRAAASASAGGGAFDQAIYLYWDAESSESSTLSDIESVSVGTTYYRYLTVAPKSSKTVSGTVTLTFTLAAETDCVVTGLTVSVYKTDSLANDSNVASLISGKTAEPVLDANHLSGTTTFSVAVDSAAHTTSAFYAISVVYDGSAAPGTTLGGTVTIHQDFGA